MLKFLRSYTRKLGKKNKKTSWTGAVGRKVDTLRRSWRPAKQIQLPLCLYPFVRQSMR